VACQVEELFKRPGSILIGTVAGVQRPTLKTLDRQQADAVVLRNFSTLSELDLVLDPEKALVLIRLLPLPFCRYSF